MPRTLTIAAVQMSATAAPTAERIARAEHLIADAVAQGAQLVVLPELFNTGYSYTPDTPQRAEPFDGPTVRWMQATAARHGIHLAGSMLLHTAGAIDNALLLWSPTGQFWRYDKTYPWGWEGALFRPGKTGPVVAETSLGRLGLLICWDTAHPELWAAYAGRVDCMVVASCPPAVSDPTYHIPPNTSFTAEALGPAMQRLRGDGPKLFGPMFDQQVAWLGVPAVNTVGCGAWRSPLPRGMLSLLGMVPGAPKLLRYLPRANRLEIACPLIAECKIVGADGVPLVKAPPDSEQAVVATVALADTPPQPHQPQPASLLEPMTYTMSDRVLPRLTAPLYRKALRRKASSTPQR